jgi:hypothetical protein
MEYLKIRIFFELLEKLGKRGWVGYVGVGWTHVAHDYEPLIFEHGCLRDEKREINFSSS